jgi:hypothetical protein
VCKKNSESCAIHLVYMYIAMFGVLEAVHNFITVSSIRHDKFVNVQKNRGERVMELPLQCDTRWTYKLKAVPTFKSRLQSIVITLKFFSESKKPRERVEAKGLLSQLMSPSVVFMVHVFERVLLVTNCLCAYC